MTKQNKQSNFFHVKEFNKKNQPMTDSDKIQYVTESINELVETLWNGKKYAFVEKMPKEWIEDGMNEDDIAICIGNEY